MGGEVEKGEGGTVLVKVGGGRKGWILIVFDDWLNTVETQHFPVSEALIGGYLPSLFSLSTVFHVVARAECLSEALILTAVKHTPPPSPLLS